MPAESTYCGPRGADHVRYAAAVQAVILAIWGTAGLASYETELRARRLARRRATKPGRKGTNSVSAIAALLSARDRQRLEDRLRELREVDREMRAPGSLAAPDEPVPLHRAGYRDEVAERTTP